MEHCVSSNILTFVIIKVFPLFGEVDGTFFASNLKIEVVEVF